MIYFTNITTLSEIFNHSKLRNLCIFKWKECNRINNAISTLDAIIVYFEVNQFDTFCTFQNIFFLFPSVYNAKNNAIIFT